MNLVFYFWLTNVIFPLVAIFSSGLLVLVWLFMPDPAKKIWNARWDKKSQILVDCSEDGIMQILKAHTEVPRVQSTNPAGYRGIPTMASASKVILEGEEIDISKEDRELLSNAFRKRFVLQGLNRPAFISYGERALSMSPSLVHLMEDIIKKGKEIIDPRVAAFFFSNSITPEIFRALELKSEEIGKYGKPKDWKRFVLPIAVIMFLAVVVIVLAQSGAIPSFKP